jgi:protein SCO1/2
MSGNKIHNKWACLAVAALLNNVSCVVSASSPPSGVAMTSSHSLFDRSWRWIDEYGAVAVFSQWHGGLIVVAAVYTSCTTRCPMTIQKVRAVDEAYRRAGVRAEIVLVTLDPRNDTPERLRRFKVSHDIPDRWHLLSGDESTTHEVARFLGTRAAFDDGHIDHDARISVFDQQGRLARTVQGWDFDAAAMVVR